MTSHAATPSDHSAGSHPGGKQVLPRGSRLGEVHLAVTDKERALAFWTEVFGLTELGEASSFPSPSGR